MALALWQYSTKRFTWNKSFEKRSLLSDRVWIQTAVHLYCYYGALDCLIKSEWRARARTLCVMSSYRLLWSPCNWTAGRWKQLSLQWTGNFFLTLSMRLTSVYFSYIIFIIFFSAFLRFSFPCTVIYHHPDGTLSPTTLSHQYHNSRSLYAHTAAEGVSYTLERCIRVHASSCSPRASGVVDAYPAENRKIIWPTS